MEECEKIKSLDYKMGIIIKVYMVATVFSKKTIITTIMQFGYSSSPHPPTATQIKKERRKGSR